MFYTISASNHVFFPNILIPRLNFPLVSSQVKIPTSQKVFLVVKKSYFSCKFELRSVSWRVKCKGLSINGSVSALEGEILEFMRKSERPNEFPTKKELSDAGRNDLVQAILNEGGWLALGWDSDVELEENALENEFEVQDFEKLERFQEDNLWDGEGGNVCSEGFRNGLESSQLPSPSGRSLGMVHEGDTGIEGILKRLEKHRNMSFGIDLGKGGHVTYNSSKDNNGRADIGISNDADRTDHGKNGKFTSISPSKSVLEYSGSHHSHDGHVSDFVDTTDSSFPTTWTTWSIQRAGSCNLEFEAAEISFGVKENKGEDEDVKDQMRSDVELLDYRVSDHNQIKTHLHHLELELSSALHSLRSKSEKLVPEGQGFTSNDLWQLSDVLEFQENEFMNAQNRLRSIRAKLAVLEGKMALAIIDTQKIAEEKQKRIESAQRALELLRTVHIVWPNSASEVRIAGSFDGWTTQRKMEKSRTGIFSVPIKLYPGRYEIKFVVDGLWRIDPLRPVVNNNGHENNIIIVH